MGSKNEAEQVSENVLALIGRDEEPLGIFFQEQGTKIFTQAKM